MKTNRLLCCTLAVAASLLGGCSKPPSSSAAYNPPKPKPIAQIKQEIDADPKIPANMKAVLKERVETGGSGGITQPGQPAAMPATVSGYLKSSGANNGANP